MVTVTGWNEWHARKLSPDDPASNATDHAIFVDNFNMTYSRDAEMMKGGYGDNYYMQLVRNLRAFKGNSVEGSDNVALFEKKTVSLSDSSAWGAISRKYLDIGVSSSARDFRSVDPDLIYKEDAARNDIDYLQMASDSEYLYVAVTCKAAISPYNGTDNNWMNVYLSCGGAGWAGYDFVINRAPGNGETSIKRISASGETTAAGKARYALSGDTVVFAVPLSALGVREKSVIGVKAADGFKAFADADAFYTHGDCAPMGRLNYAYKIA